MNKYVSFEQAMTKPIIAVNAADGLSAKQQANLLRRLAEYCRLENFYEGESSVYASQLELIAFGLRSHAKFLQLMAENMRAETLESFVKECVFDVPATLERIAERIGGNDGR